jgi:uncharacterized protein YuzE
MYGGYSILIDDDENAVITVSDARNTQGTILVPVLDEQGNPLIGEDGNPVYVEESLMELSYIAYKFSPEGDLLWEEELTRGFAYTGVAALKNIQLDNGDYLFAWQAWGSDERQYIVLEKVSKEGELIWGGPKTLSGASTNYSYPYLVNSTFGDYILVYTEGTVIYANRYYDGEPAWENRVTVYRGGFTLQQWLCFDVISDQKGGIIAGWYDDRNGSKQEKVYVQHIKEDGTNAYVTGSQEGLRVSFGNVAWSSSYPDVYEPLRAFRPDMTYDPVNDALYVVFEEDDSNQRNFHRVVMQKVNGQGELKWIDYTDHAEEDNTAGIEISTGAAKSVIALAKNGNIVVLTPEGNKYHATLYNPTDDVPTTVWEPDTVYFTKSGSSKGSLKSSQLINGEYFITTWGNAVSVNSDKAGIFAQKLNLDGTLGGAPGTDETAINNILPSDAGIINYEYYNILGSKLNRKPIEGIFIEKALKTDGTFETKKIFINK